MAETKLLPFWKWHFQMHFLDSKYMDRCQKCVIHTVFCFVVFCWCLVTLDPYFWWLLGLLLGCPVPMKRPSTIWGNRSNESINTWCYNTSITSLVVTLFPTKIHENTHMYNTLTVVSPQNVRMYFVSGCQKKLRLIELAAATCYLQFCRATARTGPEEMTHWHPGGRFKESFSSNGFHNIYSIILSRIISRYVPFHQMSF